MEAESNRKLVYGPKTSIDTDSELLAYANTKKKMPYKTMRAFRSKGIAFVPNQTQREAQKKRMTEMAAKRVPFLKMYHSTASTYKTAAEATASWMDWMKKNPDVIQSFGVDDEGLKRRLKLNQEGFQLSGGAGKFKPYYIQNGILRGGLTAKGINEGDKFSIPVKPQNDTRILQSLMAKYTNPMLCPATRIIKFIRGHWGVGKGTTIHEAVW